MPKRDDQSVLPLANHDATDWPNTTQSPFSAIGRSRWLEALDWAGDQLPKLPKFVVGVLVVVAGSLILWATLQAVIDGSATFEPISVSKEFEDRGLTGAVLSKRVLDEIHLIKDEGKTTKEHAHLDGGGHRELLSTIQLPQTSLSVQTIVTILRDLIGRTETRIGGELSGGRWGKDITLVVRTEYNKERHTKRLSGPDLDKLIREAAIEILWQIDPYILAAYYYRQGQRNEQQFEKMNETIDHILTKSDGPLRAWALNLRGIRLADLGAVSEAEAYYDQAIKLNGRFGHPYLNKGVLAAKRGDHQAAIDLYRKAHAFDPDGFLPLNNWGALLANLEDFDEAIIKLQQAIMRDPNQAMTHGVLGSLLEKMSDFGSAAASLERAFQLEPTNVYFLRSLGAVLYKAKEPARADEHFNGAWKRLHDVNVYNAWGDALRAAGRFQVARGRYQDALDVSPDNIYALSQIGRSWLDQGVMAKAEDSCEKVIQVDKASLLAQVLCGDVYRGRDNRRSLDHYIQARQLSPRDANVLAKVAWSYYATGQPELGAQAYRQASTINPADRSIYLAWGSWLLSEQDYKAALNQYDASIRVFPANEAAYEGRTIALQCLDEMKEASKSRNLYDMLKARKDSVAGQDHSAPAMFESFSRFGKLVPP